uniref:EB domain-containing protein n=1 Tax=Heligmosomoides polygyrus TaxID=6339 RepID=A0A183F834_HELPZ
LTLRPKKCRRITKGKFERLNKRIQVVPKFSHLFHKTCPSPSTCLFFQERGRPVYCSASQPQLCPSNYVCQAAVGSPGTFVCCSSGSSSSLTCPARYSPSLDPNGNQIFCSPTSSVDCPGGSSCLQSTQTAAVYLCCRDDSSARVCPNNQNAFITPGGTVETCNAPGAPCSHAGYTCQLSTPLAQYVCCGNDPAPAYCADGRSTYEQIAGQTYACNPLQFPSSCPVGYQCAQSTVAGTSVCCAIGFGPIPTLAPSRDQCPAGWSSYRNDVDLRPRNCSGPFDMG